MKWIQRLRSWFGVRNDDPRDVIASLLLAAKEDENFRRQVLLVLHAPAPHRQSLVNSAVHEMTLRGEPGAVRAAFAVLATDAGAQAALKVLSEP